MSIPRRISVSCPNCGKNFETTIFESLNTDFAPDVIETVISGGTLCREMPKLRI